MAEPFEEYWKVVRPNRHPAREESKPIPAPLSNTSLGSFLRILQGYAQGLLDTGGTIPRGETPPDFEEGIRPWADAIQSSGVRETLESFAQQGYPIVLALQQESDVPAALNRLREVLQPRMRSSSLLREAYARGQGQGPIPEVSPGETLRRVQETVREMLRRGIRLEPGVTDRLRADMDSTANSASPIRQLLEADPNFQAATQQLGDGAHLGPLRRVEVPEDQREPQETTYAELEVQFQARLEEMRAQGVPIDSDLNELRTIFLEGFYDSTRSIPTGDPELFWSPNPGVPSNQIPGVQLHGARADLALELQRFRETYPAAALRQPLEATPSLQAELQQEDGSNVGLVLLDDEMMTPEEAERMNFQIEENALWYRSLGIDVTRSYLARAYRENGGLRMDFTPERAEEERLQRMVSMRRRSSGSQAEAQAYMQTRMSPAMRARLDADIAEAQDFQESQETRRLVPGHFTSQIGFNYYGAEPSTRTELQSLGRRSELLLNITNLFNELGVHCTVLNHQGSSNIELQFRIFRDTPEGPTSIEGELPSDGSVRFRLGYRAQIS